MHDALVMEVKQAAGNVQCDLVTPASQSLGWKVLQGIHDV